MLHYVLITIDRFPYIFTQCSPVHYPGAEFLPQTMTEIQGVLVNTGVYKPGQSPEKGESEKLYKGHRDFPYNNELYKPAIICEDVHKAIEYILDREQISFQ